MLLFVCSAIAALACTDIDRPVEKSGPKVAQEAQGPPVVLTLTCTFSSTSTTVSCATARPPIAAGVSASVIYGSTPTYATFVAFNLVKDLVAQQWSFTAYVQNLLKQSVGTLNGTTVTGLKVFVTDFHATAGTGAVSIANADGTGTFTAPNQPYFNYNQIIGANANSSNKLWKFNVPNTVTAVSMSILISTDFPAEQNVTTAPPTTVPDWVKADSNIGLSGAITMRYAKRVVKIYFRSTATLADRQLAVAYVNGTVVGGWRSTNGVDGFYVVQVPDDGSGTGVVGARTRLQSLPQVKDALALMYVGTSYLKPNDSTSYQFWRLNPDSADTLSHKWNFEQVDAPFAWGCSIGSATTAVGVLDLGLHGLTDFTGNITPSENAFQFPLDSAWHGTWVTSILASVGDNQRGMTGGMWRARIRVLNPEQDSANHANQSFPDAFTTGLDIARLAANGVRVINISLGIDYVDSLTKRIPRKPGSYAYDTSSARNAFAEIMEGIRQGQTIFNQAPLPLLVVAAGNFMYAGNTHVDDAWWSVYPRLADSLRDTVLVVGASGPSRQIAWFSAVNSTTGANMHHYVDLMAPGDDVWALGRGDLPVQVHGTSFAAPLVTAAVGLLTSFDSTLGLPTANHGPPELKHLILEGADSNTTTSGSQRLAGGYSFLSMYKPLVLAAKRKGAPLCRNRVWVNGLRVIASRSSTLLDTLYTATGNDVELVDTYHGGRRLDIEVHSDTAAYELTLYNKNSTWSAFPLAPPGDYSISGSQRSYSNYENFASLGGASHNGDSLAALHITGLGQGQAVVTNSTGTTLRTLGTITQNVSQVWAMTYSPTADALYSATSGSSYNGVEVWRIPVDGGMPVRLYQLPGALAASLQVSEDGRELNSDVQLAGGPGFRCWTEYRSASTGVRLDSVNFIPYPDCSADEQGGASASRMHPVAVRSRRSESSSSLRSLLKRP